MTNRLLYAVLWGFASLALVSCGGKPKPRPAKIVKKKAPAKLGQACRTSGDGIQGSCAEGLACLGTAPGGMCVGDCPCGDGQACVETVGLGSICAGSCAGDEDCRDGYTCDATWKACAPPGLLALKAPRCEPPTPPLPRKAFGKVLQLSTPRSPGKGTFGPSAAVNKAGDLVVVYGTGGGLTDGNTLAVSTVDVTNDSVRGDIPIDLGRENQSDGSLVADEDNLLYLAWLAYDGGLPPYRRMQVGFASSLDGTEWSPAVAANDVAADCPDDTPDCLMRPVVAIGPDRVNTKNQIVYVFYHSTVNKGLRVTHSLDRGKTFSPSTPVGDGTYADATVTDSGKVHVIYVGGKSSASPMGSPESAVFYTNSGDGGATFAQPIRVSGAGESLPQWFSNPQILIDLRRLTIYAVYPAGNADGRWDIILATSKDGGETWTRTTVNDDAGACATHLVPAAALDSVAGRVHVTWFDNRSGAGSLAYSVCNPGGTKCSANEVVNDQPFAAFGFVQDGAHSLGEQNALVVDARRKRLYSVWSQPVDENGTPASRVFFSSAKIR